MSLINKMNVGNTDYDIQDRLMPDAIGQAGQVLKVKDDGSGLEFSTIESGGGKLYKHQLKIGWSSGNFNIYEVSSNEKKTASNGLYFYINIYTTTADTITLDYFKDGDIYPASIYGLVITDGGKTYSGAGMMRVQLAMTTLIFYIYGVIGPQYNDMSNYTLRLNFSAPSPTITDVISEL